jgi:lipopolysaccharide transport system ATP-binding protein
MDLEQPLLQPQPQQQPQQQPAVVVDHLHKAYNVYASPFDRIKRLVAGKGRFLTFKALDDVSFTVPRGSAVGIIGENGAGKSTLLKIISGTTAPSQGQIKVYGVVAAILELGAAFHPEFTGRDNAVLYGALMGLERTEMLNLLDAIIDFAELGDFIDHPIKCYSTGMVMRLAFAVATHVDPDLLVVDEALAVGDGYFQKKCVNKILDIKARGTTILFCSHSMYYVTSFCDRAIWLGHGKIEEDGPAQQVVTHYEEYLVTREKRRLDAATEVSEQEQEQEQPQLPAGHRAMIRGIRVCDAEGAELRSYSPGAALQVEVTWESVDPEARFQVGVSLDRGDGNRVVGVATQYDGISPPSGAGVHRIEVLFHSLPLAQGTYSVTAYLFDESGLHVYDQAVLTDYLSPASDRWAPALLDITHTWG